MSETLRKLSDYRRTFGSRGLWLAVRTKLSRQPYEVEVIPPQARHPLRLRLKTSDLATYAKVFIHREYDLLLGKEPAVIIDAGANVGLASIFFANRYSTAKVLAVEPESSNFALLTRNVAAYPNILPLQAALWKANATIDLVDPGIGHWGFQAREAADEADGPRLGKVQGLTVDTLMARHGFGYVDILKIDIEGGEKEVFENASPWIGKVGVIMIELHDRLRVGCARAFYLGTKDFDLELQKGESVFLLRREYASA
jgi:FkbM family methyltransferase